jgi:titin
VHVSGSLNSEANKTYRLEFFANAGCDPSGHGEGKVFIGFTTVMTNPNDVAFGPLDFSVSADRHVITATATDPDGNTSEFSVCGSQDTIFSDGLDGD